MSKAFAFPRFDVSSDRPIEEVIQPNPKGVCMLASDAINREAVNAGEIRTLKVQLIDAKKTIAALRGAWVRLPGDLPAEPGSCLAMFKPDNDFGITTKYAVQVEFGEFTTGPREFTMFIDYENRVVTDQITHWRHLPATPEDLA